MRPLVGLQDQALADLGNRGLAGGHVEILALDVHRPFAFPDLQHRVDTFDKHRIAVLLEVAERLGVRHQAARADAHDEAALEHVVQHRDLPGDGGRVAVGHVDGATAQHDVASVMRQTGQEHQTGGHVLRQVGHVLADKAFGKAEPVGQQEGLTVLFQRFGCDAPGRVQRHHEHAEFHQWTPVVVFMDGPARVSRAAVGSVWRHSAACRRGPCLRRWCPVGLRRRLRSVPAPSRHRHRTPARSAR